MSNAVNKLTLRFEFIHLKKISDIILHFNIFLPIIKEICERMM